MAEEFQTYYAELDEQLEDSERFLAQLRNKRGSLREQGAEQLEKRLGMIKDDIEVAENEFNCIRDRRLQDQLRPKVDELRRRHAELVEGLAELTAPAEQPAAEEEKPVEKVHMTATQKLQFASVVYDDAMDHLNDAHRTLLEVKEINDQVTEQLVADTAKMERIADDLVDLRAENRIARRQLRQLAQRVTSNKCYVAIFFVVILVVLGLTIADIVKTVKK